uniref:hypothetical protein n=1 Tax=Limnohabitans sp. TaxID=1907725 RepID=UPI00404820E9
MTPTKINIGYAQKAIKVSLECAGKKLISALRVKPLKPLIVPTDICWISSQLMPTFTLGVRLKGFV